MLGKPMIPIPDHLTVAEAREFMYEHLEEGVRCLCDRRFGFDKRSLYDSVTKALSLVHEEGRQLARVGAELWVHTPRFLHGKVTSAARGGDWAKLRHWGLIERRPGKRGDGWKWSGYWRLTQRGRDFVDGLIKVPKQIFIFKKQLVFKPDQGLQVTIKEALGAKWNEDGDVILSVDDAE